MPTLPPPCFTDEVVCLGSWAVPCLHSSGTTSYGQMRPRSTCTRVMGREEYGEGKELLMILSIPPHQWSMVVVAWACMAASGTGSLVFIDDVTTDKAEGWILKCFGQYYLLIFSQMLQNSLDGASQCRWTMTQSILQKQPKSFEGKELDCYAMAKSITWPESDWACISLAEDKTEGKMPQEQAGTEDGCSRGLAEHYRDETQRLVMSMRSRLQAVIDCKGFATKY